MALPIIWLIASAVTTGLTIQNQKNTAKAQAFELERQGEQEELSAEGRELERRQKLNKVLAANVVGQANSGIAGEGTPASIALGSAKQASISEGIESLSDRLKQDHLKRQADNVRSAGNTQAASTLLKGASQVAKLS